MDNLTHMYSSFTFIFALIFFYISTFYKKIVFMFFINLFTEKHESRARVIITEKIKEEKFSGV